jgi:hypothetical protein
LFARRSLAECAEVPKKEPPFFSLLLLLVRTGEAQGPYLGRRWYLPKGSSEKLRAGGIAKIDPPLDDLIFVRFGSDPMSSPRSHKIAPEKTCNLLTRPSHSTYEGNVSLKQLIFVLPYEELPCEQNRRGLARVLLSSEPRRQQTLSKDLKSRLKGAFR